MLSDIIDSAVHTVSDAQCAHFQFVATHSIFRAAPTRCEAKAEDQAECAPTHAQLGSAPVCHDVSTNALLSFCTVIHQCIPIPTHANRHFELRFRRNIKDTIFEQVDDEIILAELDFTDVCSRVH